MIIEVDIKELNQIANKQMFIGELRIEDLKSIIKYTERIALPKDPFAKDFDGEKEAELDYYQRVKNSDRTYDIKLFLLKNIYREYCYNKKRISPLALFPSSVILSLKVYPDKATRASYEKYLAEEDRPDYCLLVGDSILIPKLNNALIVDGQHRIAGLESLYNEALNGTIKENIRKNHLDEEFIKELPEPKYIIKKLKEFQFIVTFLIDFDRYEQAEIFATVNFTQKPVNKSYYYDIFGSADRGNTIEKLLHDIVSHLNFYNDSPLKGRIKMLGTGPGSFSQAFLVEALLPHFRKGFLSSILIDFQRGGSEYKEVPKFLRAYFGAIIETFEKYTSPTSGVLLKTTGMGALILLMPNIYRSIKERIKGNVFSQDEQKLKNIIKSIFDKIKGNGEKYFSAENGEFSKGAGKGLQSKLYKLMATDLGYNPNE